MSIALHKHLRVISRSLCGPAYIQWDISRGESMARKTPFHLIPQRFIIYIPFDEVESPTSSPPFSLFLKQYYLPNGKYRNFLYGSFPTCAHLPVVSSSPDWCIGQWLMRFFLRGSVNTHSQHSHSFLVVFSQWAQTNAYWRVCTLIIACRGKFSFLVCVVIVVLRNWVQDLTHASQVLCQWAAPQVPKWAFFHL